MSKVFALRALVTERLTAAAEEIFALVERTIVEYEEELCRSKEENQRKQQLLDSFLNTQPHTAAQVNERLTAAAEEIFALVERTIVEYEEELCRSQRGEPEETAAPGLASEPHSPTQQHKVSSGLDVCGCDPTRGPTEACRTAASIPRSQSHSYNLNVQNASARGITYTCSFHT
ncbi:hypothetical protein WMY93_024753 [Mugilogobius chulae]|uniref:Uncharacterized protein n=1 Tax=Mugilogobius chulae TaxID=88201 RepID=A0AAW0N1I1_9GOBI